MFQKHNAFTSARASYANIDLASRIQGASPHQLVMIMFDEGLKALDAMVLAANRNDFARYSEKQTRVLSVLHGLETSLDFDLGGEIATGLASIYREARRLVVLAGRDRITEPLTQARQMLGEISEAWEAIGGR